MFSRVENLKVSLIVVFKNSTFVMKMFALKMSLCELGLLKVRVSPTYCAGPFVILTKWVEVISPCK